MKKTNLFVFCIYPITTALPEVVIVVVVVVAAAAGGGEAEAREREVAAAARRARPEGVPAAGARPRPRRRQGDAPQGDARARRAARHQAPQGLHREPFLSFQPPLSTTGWMCDFVK